MALICLNKLNASIDQKRFEQVVRAICLKCNITNPNWLMLCFNAESNMRYPSINRIGAVGFIQITPSTAQDLGTSAKALAALDPIAYLAFVKKYLQMRIKQYGTPQNAYELYTLIHYPAAFQKASSYILYRKGSKAYQENPLDYNTDGLVTLSEMYAFFDKRLPILYDKEQLFLPENPRKIYWGNIELAYLLYGLLTALLLGLISLWIFKQKQVNAFFQKYFSHE